MNKLMRVVESDELASEFYLYTSSTEWLVRWLERQPLLQVLRTQADANEDVVRNIATRAFEFAEMNPKPGRRIRREPALCCYAFILASIPSDRAAGNAVEELYSLAAPHHGWLRRILDRLNSGASTVTWVDDHPSPVIFLEFSDGVSFTDRTFNSIMGSSFDTITEIPERMVA
ncbi:MAG: hypothetical protein M3Y56_06520 [Armatimonadota bacterium]|nr:hypothetical protein [Armatimonadota bacterium]